MSALVFLDCAGEDREMAQMAFITTTPHFKEEKRL